jgi:hypothetical protein
MTLSRFLRDYLYIPLGGNRHGRLRRYVNLMTTMILGGLWHGAGWTFVVWGALHGAYLVVNHAWQALRGGERAAAARKPTFWAWLLTFLAVVIGWVFFRAKDLDTAFDMLRGMAGLNGVVLPEHWFKAPSMAGVKDWLLAAGATTAPVKFTAYRDQVYLTLELLLVATLAPNSQQIMQRFRPTIDRFKPLAGALARWTWQPNLAWLSVMTLLFVWALLEIPRGDKVSEFLYFQF